MCKSKTTFLILLYSVLHIFPVHPINSKKSGVDLKKIVDITVLLLFMYFVRLSFEMQHHAGGGEESRSLFLFNARRINWLVNIYHENNLFFNFFILIT